MAKAPSPKKVRETMSTARSNLMSGMQVAFENPDLSPEMREVMSHEMARVEKLFRFEPHSFGRGC